MAVRSAQASLRKGQYSKNSRAEARPQGLQRKGIWAILTTMKRRLRNALIASIAAALIAGGCSKDGDADSREAQAHFEAGVNFLNQRMYKRAEEEFSLAIGIDPDQAAAYCDRGLVYYMTGRDEDAMRDFESALHRDPTLGKAHFHRALLLDHAGARAEAISAYESFIRYSKQSPTIYIQRANRRIAELKENAPPLPR